MENMDKLIIKYLKLIGTIQRTSRSWSAIPNSTEMRPLGLTREDKQVRDWLVAECKGLGCEVKIDQMGNIFCVRPGKLTGVKPIAMGSRLETQSAGGRYDGVLGILCGIEVLRTLHEHNYETNYPIALIGWTNEGRTRFPGAMMSSGVWSGKYPTGLEACHAFVDPDGISMREALEKIGYLGDVPCNHQENGIEAHFELHMEHDPILEQQQKLGIVTSIRAMKWYEIRVNGKEEHSETTPTNADPDALATTSRLISAVENVSSQTDVGEAMIGVVRRDISIQSEIPAGVGFIVDVRCSTDEQVDEFCAAIFKQFDLVVAEEDNGTSYEIERVWGLPESTFDAKCVEISKKVTIHLVGEDRVLEMQSRSSHDSAWTSKVVPTGMIFVPSKDEISHNPTDSTSLENCWLGAQALLSWVLEYDEYLGSR
ncbi:MAG: hypothetical protein M1834_007854 [Cirrosporium novae-zelandiae]|nr:MAG: hypothetical protein M1834_007854 [Cirrosporium novae-zelandiae]